MLVSFHRLVGEVLKAWKEALPVLEGLRKDSSAEGIQRAMSDCSALGATQLDLREACTLYRATDAFVAALHRDGIRTFNVAALVEELVKAERIFQGLSLHKERLLKVPEMARKAKRALQSGLVSMQVRTIQS